MQPADLLEPSGISVANSATSKKRALEEMARLLAEAVPEISQETIYERLLERERLGSTGVGHGVALPHARIEGLSRAYVAFAQLARGVDFDASDDEPVDLIFALVVPQEATAEHLQLLAQLATLFSNEAIRTQLRRCGSAQEVISGMRVPAAARHSA